MKTLKLITISLFAIVFATACSKSKDGSVATAAVTFYKSNGLCYDAKTNAQVAATNCSAVAYYLQNNTCYASTNHAVSDMTNCHTLVGQYYYVGNNCYDKVARSYCAQSFCQGTGTGTERYKWMNTTTCVDTHMNNMVVNSSYCLNPNGNGNRCVESNRYLYYTRGQWYTMNCATYDCGGLSLWDQRTNSQVNCAY